MYALVDCNNFYVSVERLFQPKYNGIPTLVLSNNDGCVISRSAEVKALGIPMGSLFHKIQEEIKHFNIKYFSSNYTLYADISARVMNNLARFSPDIEVYSIDEAFIGLSGFKNLYTYGQTIKQTIERNTGIPISIGIAPTKVLAKVANKMAKKSTDIYLLETPVEITKALENFPIEDIWGIGRQYAKKLNEQGIFTALQFRQLPLQWIQKNMTVTGARIWRELHGEPCMELQTDFDPKQILSTAKGFGKLTSDLQELREATADYTARLASKLRAAQLCASVVSLRLLSSRFRKDLPQYNPGYSLALNHPANNTLELSKAALHLLRGLYKPGIQFQK